MNKKELWRTIKFTLFSISAGAIQLLSFAILYEWTHWLAWWPAYLISVILSVIWNFTFNRKFTFKSANNVPKAMALVLLYYCAFTPASVFGGNALEAAWGSQYGIVVTILMMLINFVTEFLWDRFVVFRGSVDTNDVAQKEQSRADEKEETQSDDSEKIFDVVLLDAGDDKMNVVKIIRRVVGLDIKTVKKLVDDVPSVIAERQTQQKAQSIADALSEVGAITEIR